MIFRNKLRIATTGQVHFVDINDIIRIQSDSNYSRLFFTNGKSMMVSKVLARFDEQLTGHHFVRIHRTHLVNSSFIRHLEWDGMPRIGLNNDEVLPVSRRRKKLVQREMEINHDPILRFTLNTQMI